MRGQKTGGRRAGTPNKANRDLMALAQQYTPAAVDTLVAIMNDIGKPPQARVQAAKELLDRGHGRASQSIAMDGESLSPIVIRWKN